VLNSNFVFIMNGAERYPRARKFCTRHTKTSQSANPTRILLMKYNKHKKNKQEFPIVQLQIVFEDIFYI